MPDWYCRNARTAASATERCEGPRHRECGMRYAPGEYTLTAGFITLPDIGTVRAPGVTPAFIPRSAAAIVWQDNGAWTVEFDKGGVSYA